MRAESPFGEGRLSCSVLGSASVAPRNDVTRVLGAAGLAWHDCGMARTRLSTTVNAELLEGARRVKSGVTDAILIDAALEALLAGHRAAEADASYAA